MLWPNLKLPSETVGHVQFPQLMKQISQICLISIGRSRDLLCCNSQNVYNMLCYPVIYTYHNHYYIIMNINDDQ